MPPLLIPYSSRRGLPPHFLAGVFPAARPYSTGNIRAFQAPGAHACVIGLDPCSLSSHKIVVVIDIVFPFSSGVFLFLGLAAFYREG